MKAFIRTAITASIIPVIAACSRDGATALLNVDAVDVVFLTQTEPQTAHMDALFKGRVIIDGAKCTRMDDPDSATVIWPPGFTVSGEDGALDVFDGDGHKVGRLGSTFRIGGGIVPVLSPQLHINYVDRARADESCPGEYWIASEVQR